MGLLGNVAEVPLLRHKLMTKEFVDEFSFLLDSNSDGIEVSYNAGSLPSWSAIFFQSYFNHKKMVTRS